MCTNGTTKGSIIFLILSHEVKATRKLDSEDGSSVLLFYRGVKCSESLQHADFGLAFPLTLLYSRFTKKRNTLHLLHYNLPTSTFLLPYYTVGLQKNATI